MTAVLAVIPDRAVSADRAMIPDLAGIDDARIHRATAAAVDVTRSD